MSMPYRACCVFLRVLQSNIFILILIVYTLHVAINDLVQSASIQPVSHLTLLTILLVNVSKELIC